MNVRLAIDRLVLDGIDVAAHERPRLRAAAEVELARVLAERGVSGDLARGIAVPSLRAGDLALAADATPAQIGTAIGRAIGEGVAS